MAKEIIREDELANWNDLGRTSATGSIETIMLAECMRVHGKSPKSAIPTRYFKENYAAIFGRNSSNPQPRLNLAMRRLANSELVELKKVAGKNYVRWLDPATLTK